DARSGPRRHARATARGEAPRPRRLTPSHSQPSIGFGASLPSVIPSRETLLRRALAVVILATLGLVAAGCSVLLEPPPAPPPADFGGIAGDMVQRGIRLDHIASGDAGCPDQTLAQTAIRFDAEGLDQTSPTRLYIYIFRDRDA